MSRIFTGIIFVLFLSGCSMFSSKAPYESALDDAFSEVPSLDSVSRGVTSVEASIKGLNLNIKRLSSFEMLVFPKVVGHHMKRGLPKNEDQEKINSMSDQERKYYFDSKMVYYEPQVFNFKVLVNSPCRKLKKRRKFHTNKFFTGETFKPGQRCFVLEGRRKRPKFFGKIISNVRKEDLLAIRLFLDDHFRPHGQSLDFAVKLGSEK